MRRLILRSFQSPGDVLMLTAAVRDLHAAHGGQFQTDVRTSADAIWLHNPHVTQLKEGEPGVETLDMHYPLVHQSNQRPYHFLHGYAQYLEEQLGLRVPLTRFQGDIHLSPEEKALPVPGAEHGVPERFWIIIAGGKNDFTAKWWNPASYQAVVDHFQGRVTFVQCGEAGHWHPPLKNAINLLGKTSLREFIRLMYHADGVVCPVTFAMHLAAAVETKPGRPKSRPCVVVAGGREPAHWEAYPTHQYISTVGMLPCCESGGCWKSRCQPVGDGDAKDRRDLCERPVQITPELRIPECLDMISPQDVIRRVELFLSHQSVAPRNGQHKVQPMPTAQLSRPPIAKTPLPSIAANRGKISVSFFHGLGDCAYFAHLIPLYVRRGFQVEVECTPDKAILFQAGGASVVAKAATSHSWGYPAGSTHEGQGRFWQGSKMGNNISQAPLPNIGDKAELWDEYVETRIDIAPHLPPEAVEKARRWSDTLPRPLVLLHTKGNTGQERKSLPDEVATEFYKAFLDTCDGSLVLLDWDHRVPRLASYRIRHLDELGGCSTETMLALIGQADLLIGVDSGPLHASRFTRTPAMGIWMPGHYPATYTLPREEQLNVVLVEHTKQWNRFKRIPWNIVEHPGHSFTGEGLAALCQQMLSGPRYLNPQQMGADVLLQEFVRERCRGVKGNSLSAHCDRNRSFDVLLREATARFEAPTFVETGTVRSEEDWSGAGFSTYLFGADLSHRGGKLHSVDLSQQHCRFARDWTAIFGPTVEVVQADSVSYLRSFAEPIDVLYLDSLDTTEPNHAEHCLNELQAALPRLHEKSLIVIDDSPWNDGAWTGKGARAIPWLCENGWRVLYGGYQAVLSR